MRDLKKEYPTFDPWSGWATHQAWMYLGGELKAKVVDAIGTDNAIDNQFGNVLGKLRDFGYPALFRELKDALHEHNLEMEQKRRYAKDLAAYKRQSSSR